MTHYPVTPPEDPSTGPMDLIDADTDIDFDAEADRLDRMDALFQATAQSLQAMKNGALTDLAQVEQGIKAQHQNNTQSTQAASIEDRLTQMQSLIQQQQDLLNAMAPAGSDMEGSLSPEEQDSLKDLLSAAASAVETIDLQPEPATSLPEDAAMASNEPTDDFTAFLEQVKAWTAHPEASLHSAAPDASDLGAQQVSSDPALSQTDGASNQDFLSSIQSILETGAQKARELEEEWNAKKSS